jgi:glycolate oxidase FAD binding subunit
MLHYEPSCAGELAALLQECASKRQTIELAGCGSKSNMGGTVEGADVFISTKNLNKLLAYEPRDLTVSIEAGMEIRSLQALLNKNGQTIALDPPFSEKATIGGVVASNSSGPMRRAFGTARDLVIGMKFATLEGRLVETGGMVVKNVAGLDMGKLMIGSFGTLAAITSVNFRVHSLPEATETYLFPYPELTEALKERDGIISSVLQPMAVDILSPAIALRFGHRGHLLAIRVCGRETLLARYHRELRGGERLRGPEEANFWSAIQEFPSGFLEEHSEGVIARVSTTISGIAQLPKTVAGSFISRAATGVTYFYFGNWAVAAPWWHKVEEVGLSGVIEHAPVEIRRDQNLWSSGKRRPEQAAFAMMEKVKQLFDPDRLLNPGRLYGRI